MKKIFIISFNLALFTGVACAQVKLNKKAVSSYEKGEKAATFSDEDATQLVRASVAWMDEHNPVAAGKDPYALRLTKIFAKHTVGDGLRLNFKVYKVADVNAFACADGSTRIFSSLMDVLTDEELLAVIGHETAPIKNHDARNAIRAAYMRAAAPGAIADAFLASTYNRQQESEADSYGYEFMKKHTYNVMTMASAIRRLHDLSGGRRESKMEKMRNAHPGNGERAKAIEEKARKDGLYK